MARPTRAASGIARPSTSSSTSRDSRSQISTPATSSRRVAASASTSRCTWTMGTCLAWVRAWLSAYPSVVVRLLDVGVVPPIVRATHSSSPGEVLERTLSG
eukprot:508032-Prymnesium_polylepis.1